MLRCFSRLLTQGQKNDGRSFRHSGAQWEETHQAEELKKMPVSARLDDNLALIKEMLGRNSDLVLRELRLGAGGNTRAGLIFVDGMVDNSALNDTLIKGLTLESRMAAVDGRSGLFAVLKEFMINVGTVREAENIFQLLDGVLYGTAGLFIDGCNRALLADVKGGPVRAIEEPISEGVVRGPRTGFTEQIRTNTSLLRRSLRTPNFVIEGTELGRDTRTVVEIAYIKGLAAPELVREVKERLSRIKIDGILESGYIEELIEDQPYSPFPQVFHSERPDRVAAALLQGRVAILTDGTPFVLVVPAEFVLFMQVPEDYYERWQLSTVIRWLRYISFVASLLLPSMYIAVTTYHQEMIPTRLLISVAASREGVPFPAFVEALLMEFTFEVLREAGIRLPRNIGQAVSIVGALVIGQAAVSASIVSPLMVIVVALTGIASFAAASYNIAITTRLLRFPMMILAATLGLFGVMIGMLVILVHMASLRSFGVPYLAPLAPLHAGDLKDVAWRAPWWAMDNRPEELVRDDRRRQTPGLMPHPPAPGGGRKGGGRDGPR
ncbi:spore germination protein [Desulfotomaculum copahuensis]|nr:spore germination protein [Desulfotomaculum copahuensis]